MKLQNTEVKSTILKEFTFFAEGFDFSQEERYIDVSSLLEPITAVIEAVLNASCGQF